MEPKIKLALTLVCVFCGIYFFYLPVQKIQDLETVNHLLQRGLAQKQDYFSRGSEL